MRNYRFIIAVYLIISSTVLKHTNAQVVKQMTGTYSCGAGTGENNLPSAVKTFSGRDAAIFKNGRIIPCQTANTGVIIKPDNTITPSIIPFSAGGSSSLNDYYQPANTNDTYTINTSAPVGFTPGGGDVSPSGAANYQIPFDLPSGPKGIRPSLGVYYNSNSSDGTLGWGWELSGISSINRIPKRYFMDGASTSLNLTNTDNLALNGNVLKVRTGTYWADQTVYNTYDETFADIKQYNAGGANPQYFTVTSKDGSVVTYGNTTASNGKATSIPLNSTVPLSWNISQYQDPDGNTINYYYQNTNGSSRISSIEYSGGNSGTPFCKIQFRYDLKTDVNTLYISNGANIQQNVLLKGVDILVNGTTYKKYVFDYEYIDNKSKLNKVTEINAASESLNPTVVKWMANAHSTVKDAVGTTTNTSNKVLMGNFNNDNLPDLFSISDTKVELFINNGSSFSKLGEMNLLFQSVSETTHSGYYTIFRQTQEALLDFQIQDFDNDGIDEIIATYSKYDHRESEPYRSTDFTTSKEETWIYKINGSSLVFSRVLFTTNLGGGGSSAADLQTNVKFGDFDGDGRTDAILIDKSNKILKASNIALTGTVQLPSQNAVICMDYDNDGKTDLISFNDKTSGSTVSSALYGYDPILNTFTTLNTSISIFDTSKDGLPMAGDFNGDGKNDFLGLIYDRTDGSGNRFYKYKIMLSNGSSVFVETQFQSALTSAFFTEIQENGIATFKSNNLVYVGDFNNDGKSDFVKVVKGANNTADFIFFINKGNYAFDQYAAYNTSFANFNWNKVTITDMNADSQSDILFTDGSNFSTISFDKNDYSLKVQHIINGNGNKTEFVYAPLKVDGSFYTLSGGQSFPFRFFKIPSIVVSSVKMPDGVGGISETQYSYTNGRLLLNGKGFLGFDKVTSKNATLDTWVDEESSTLVAGSAGFDLLPDKVTQKTYAGTVLSLTDYTYSFVAATSTSRYATLTNIDNTNYLLGTTTKTTRQYGAAPNVNEVSSEKTESYTGTASDGYTQTDYTYQSVGSTRRGLNTITKKSKIGTELEFAKTTKYEYNVTNLRLAKVIDYSDKPSLAVTSETMEWDTYGNPTKVKTSASNVPDRVFQTIYTPSGRFVKQTIDAAGLSNTYEWNEAKGWLTKQTAPNGLSVTYNAYDGQGRVLSATNALGITSTNQYQWYITGNQRYKVVSSSPGLPNSIAYFDNFGRSVLTSTDALGGNKRNTTQYYNAKGLVSAASSPYFQTDGDQNFKTNFTYATDGSNRILGTAHSSNGLAMNYSYLGLQSNSSFPIAGQSPRTGSHLSNSLGLTLWSQDASNSKVENMAFHSTGQAKTIRANGVEITTTIDPNSGLQSAVTDPASGTTSYQYNAYKQLVTQIDANSKNTTLTYTTDGKLQSKAMTNMQTIKYDYNSVGSAVGQVSQTYLDVVNEDDKQKISFTNDDKGRPTKTTQKIKPSSLTSVFTLETSLTYNSLGQVDGKTYPSGFGVKYEYDATTGDLIRIKKASDNSLIWELQSIEEDGKPINIKFGNNVLANYTYQYNGLNLPTEHKLTLPDASIYRYQTSFNKFTGNLMTRTNFESDAVGMRKTETFTYDSDNANLDRLSNASYPENGVTVDKSVSYAANGNIVTKSDVGTYEYTHPTNVYGVTKVPLSTPAAPSLLTNTQDVVYNAYNKAISIQDLMPDNATLKTRVEFEYGPHQQRIFMKIGSRYFIYGADYEAEVDASGNKLREWTYITGPYGLVAVNITGSAIANPGLYYAHTDHLGSVLLLTNASGTVQEKYNYDAWGNRRDPVTLAPLAANTGMLRRGYTFHEHLDEVGLINMNGRMYDPALGRFLNADPVVQDPSNPQNYNRYSYVLNNPLKYTDPTGYWYDLFRRARSFPKDKGGDRDGNEFDNWVGNDDYSYGNSEEYQQDSRDFAAETAFFNAYSTANFARYNKKGDAHSRVVSAVEDFVYGVNLPETTIHGARNGEIQRRAYQTAPYSYLNNGQSASGGSSSMWDEGGIGPPIKADASYSYRTNAVGFGIQKVLDFDFRLRSREVTRSVWSGYDPGTNRLTSGVALDVAVGFKAFAHEYKDGLRSVTLGASIMGIGGEIEFNQNSIINYNFGFGSGLYIGVPGINVHSLDFFYGLYKR